jgi:hypothetical protein
VEAGAADGAPDTGWTLVYEDEQAGPEESLNAIWVADKDHVFAVGDNGQIVWHEPDQWNSLNKTKGAHLYGVWGRSATDVYAVGLFSSGAKPSIFHFDGAAWTAVGPLPSHLDILSGVWGAGTSLYLTSKDGQIFRDDPVGIPSTPYKLVVVTGGCPDRNDPAPVLWSIDGTSRDNILAAGDQGLVAHRDPTGWTRLCHPDASVQYRAVFSIPGSNEYYLGANYFGLWHWTGRTQPTFKIHEDRQLPNVDELHIWDIWGTSMASVLAVGDQGTILYYNGGPDGARQLPSPTRGALFGVAGFDAHQVYICGQGNRIWKGKLPSD